MNICYYTMEQLPAEVSALPFSFPAVLMSEGGAGRCGLTKYLSERHKRGDLFWFSEIDPNPTHNTLYRARKALCSHPINAIIAIGGGSAMDLAKAVSAFHNMPMPDAPGELIRAIVDKTYLDNEKNSLPVVAVPSTAGTGSEVTTWATVWDMTDGAKYSVDAPWLKPAQAWIVPRLISSVPQRLALSVGLDAVCHAAEAYWAKASNPIAKALAIRALQIISKSLKPYLSNPQDIKLCENMCTGSLVSGLAFSSTRTTACHSISYPLTYMFGLEHGFAAAVTLARIAGMNSSQCDLNEISEVFSPYGGIQGWIEYVCEGVADLRLRAFGIEKGSIKDIAAKALSAGRADNNPVELTFGAVEEILLSVY